MKLLILTEGTQTEVIYFKSLIKHFGCTDVSVQPGKSPDPLRLLREAMLLREKLDGEVWVVLDTEMCGQDKTRDRRLKKAVVASKRFGINVAVSEPCFEAWLLSHFDGTKNYNLKNGNAVYADILSKKLGRPYRKSEYDIALLLKPENLQTAINSKAGVRGLSALMGEIIKHRAMPPTAHKDSVPQRIIASEQPS